MEYGCRDFTTKLPDAAQLSNTNLIKVSASFTPSKINDQAMLSGLKDVDRIGWKNFKIKDPENVAEHSWGVALLVSIFAPSSFRMKI